MARSYPKRTKLEVLAVILQHEGMGGLELITAGYLRKEDATTIQELEDEGKIRYANHGWFVVDHVIE